MTRLQSAFIAPFIARIFALIFVVCGGNAQAASILFVGNSFTYGHGSPVRSFRPDSVTDLNRQGMGGVPALFKAFTTAAGLDYDVSIEAVGDAGLQWHIEHKSEVIGGRPWDVAVLQGISVLDATRPGDPAKLIDGARKMTELVEARSPAVEVFLLATWPRADLIYRSKGKWAGTPIETMARDVRAGYDQAAAATPAIKGVIPVGEAWVRAIRSGVAVVNPYDSDAGGKIDLWAADNHHASSYGYYLDALVAFGRITGRDPRSLSDNECAGRELGITPTQIHALQQVAFDQLASDGSIRLVPFALRSSDAPQPCTAKQ
jgi:hypothetical protein